MLGEIGRVDVVKVDVEGAEVHAFAGLERTLGANPGITIMFEWSPEQIRQVGDDPAALLELLGRRGFRLRVLEDDLAPIDACRLLDRSYANVVARR